jgi:cardiolipin synthase
VVDGTVALMGGMNLAEEYMGPTPRADRWLDTAAIVRGRAALDLDDVFVSDWRFATGEEVSSRVDNIADAKVAAGDAVAQVVSSGPNITGDPLYEAILTAMYEVQERVWVVTPYFVPDDGLLRALRLQARLGRDVRIVVPAKSNHFFADVARGRALREMAEAGVRVYGYAGRMMHAKHLVFDDRIALVGSINFDMRSLYLNYEVVMFLYTTNEVMNVTAWMEHLMEQSSELRGEEAGALRRLAEDVTLLVSPLL